MKEAEFNDANAAANVVYECCQEWFASEAFMAVREAVKQASGALPPNYSVSLAVSFSVFDENRTQTLPLFTTGIDSCAGREPHPAGGDSTVHRYVVNGEICQVPHDYCPNCWGAWDFKVRHPVCQHCGVELGRQVKLLLDTDTCPNCEQGIVTMANPMCGHCGFLVDQRGVVWG